MKKLIWLLFLGILYSCDEKMPTPTPNELIDADIAFSDYSLKNGLQKAFIEFADDSVVLLKVNRMPIIGKTELIKSYEGKSDSGMILTWKPAKAILASSGELGYTYGFWMFVAQNVTTKGTYLTVWKKDGNGHWKYIADTGNEGLKK